MRFLLFAAIVSVPAFGQTEPQTLQTLLNEVRELRLSIDRSTLLGARTQIALQRIQMQEARTARAAQELGTVHQQAEDVATNRARIAANIKEMEEKAPRLGDNTKRQESEDIVKQLKRELEMLAGTEQRL